MSRNLEELQKKIGVSMKNTNMSATTYIDPITKKKKVAAISLHQGTSLYVFLKAMQQEHADIHNHFLNVFAADPNRLSTLRREAADAMVLSLLYSAMSGRGLGKQGGFADILAIEDKSTNLHGYPRVRFYNIHTILLDIAQRIQRGFHPSFYLQFSPNFYTFKLHNEYQESGARARITKLLLDARAQKMSMAITKKYLNYLYKNSTP